MWRLKINFLIPVFLAFGSLTFASDFQEYFGKSVDSQVRAQVLLDLEFLRAIKGQGASPLHQSVFGDVDGKDYKRFLDRRIFHIERDDHDDAGVVAFVDPERPGIMHITRNYSAFAIPQIIRLSLMIHEARHTEAYFGYWSHVACPSTFVDRAGVEIRGIVSGVRLAGAYACDNSEMGAYGIEIIMLKNIGHRCVNCTDKVKMDARIFGDDLMSRIIAEPAQQALVEDLYEGLSKGIRFADPQFEDKPTLPEFLPGFDKPKLPAR